ncbi:MAG TPA: tetratricopeptide repeat protein [Flavisolibacter sp.]
MKTINQIVGQLDEQLGTASDPITRVDLLNRQAYELRHSDTSASLEKSREAVTLSESAGYEKGLAQALLNVGFSEMVQANYEAAFAIFFRASSIFESLGDPEGRGHALYNIGVTYSRTGDYSEAVTILEQSLSIRRSLHDKEGEAACLMQLAYIYERFGNDTEALDYYNDCIELRKEIGDIAGIGAALVGTGIIRQKRKEFGAAEADLKKSLAIREEIGEVHGWLVSMNYLAELYIIQQKLGEAESYLDTAIRKANEQVPPFAANLCRLYTSLSKVHVATGRFPEAIDMLQQALEAALKANLKYLLYDIYLSLSQVYKQKGDLAQALESYESFHLVREEVINLSANARLKNLALSNQMEVERKESEIFRLRNTELKEAYEQLQRTQEQLVQTEKLAYLGHLIAGIAHEIQNPLNFVNNFADVSLELLEELIEEQRAQGSSESTVLADIRLNLQKIAFHGKRADSIVKSMLQHSRSSNDQKEPTDINTLIDEYLRLSYESAKAKDKSFRVQMETVFDRRIEKINIIPQDIGRVLLNLFNNAFYAVLEKKKNLNSFEPAVRVQTALVGDGVEITVWDNGTGIPKNQTNKIYQPFYTTKPTGEGTGLGLSLSYDIITKGHGGELRVQTEEGTFTAFTVRLPLS